MNDYRNFLEAKVHFDHAVGVEIDHAWTNPLLKPHQATLVQWACRGGRRALFAAFGLGKTLMQLEIQRLLREYSDAERALIVCPLGVRQEFRRDAEMLGQSVRFVRTSGEVDEPGLYLTNYESIREGKLNPALFDVASLDEAAVLRSFGSKTYQEFMPLFAPVRYRFVATAVPDPNEYKELIHYAGFLGIMDTGQALTRFFQRNSEKAGNLTLYPHKEREFWMWVSSWAVFLQKPSDLGFSDDGYELPALDVHYHEVAVSHETAGADRDGQGRLFRSAALGVQDAAREQRIIDFSDGKLKYLATKPELSGSGCNFQRHCNKAIFLGIGYRFHDFIQAVHRIYRFLQTKPCEIHIIYAESEREVLRSLQDKWRRHDEQVARMSEIIREFGLNHTAMQRSLTRSIGIERQEVAGERFLIANNDCVVECREMESDSVGLMVTSIPFSNHYEYTPSYNDFGHTENDDHFFAQMDFLTPELLRILKPGRVACIHVKDRILYGNVTGLGMPTVNPFHAKCIAHYQRHGFAYMGMITVVTDVVRENNQTYRLGWSEQCKDGTKMGVGSPEYVLLFRKLPTDTSRAYADEPVRKEKSDYTRARWQVDAHAFWRSSGNRLLSAADLAELGPDQLAKLYTEYSLGQVYDHEAHVGIGEALDARGALPATFMAIAPGSHHPEVWHDVVRMRTLNGEQHRRAVEFHVCPLQIDIVERLIRRYSNEGDVVFDPFGGLMTVPYIAIKMRRFGRGVELNPGYFRDGVHYCQAAERELLTPTLFDVLESDQEVA